MYLMRGAKREGYHYGCYSRKLARRVFNTLPPRLLQYASSLKTNYSPVELFTLR